MHLYQLWLMKEKLKNFIHELHVGIIGSLNTKKNEGFSARKITAIAVNTLYIATHIVWYKHAFLREDFEHLTIMTIIDALYVLLLLGIVTFEQVIQFKNGEKNEDHDKDI